MAFLRRRIDAGPYNDSRGIVGPGAVVERPDDMARAILRDFPNDWEVVAESEISLQVSTEDTPSAPEAPSPATGKEEPTLTTEESVPVSFEAEEVRPTPEEAVDQLAELPGIGKALATRLVEADILTLPELASEENRATVEAIVPERYLNILFEGG